MNVEDQTRNNILTSDEGMEEYREFCGWHLKGTELMCIWDKGIMFARNMCDTIFVTILEWT